MVYNPIFVTNRGNAQGVKMAGLTFQAKTVTKRNDGCKTNLQFPF